MIKSRLVNTTVKINPHCLREKCPHESGCGYKYLFDNECTYIKNKI
jgi:hypothetical protein